MELKAGYTREGSSETYLGLTEADFRGNPLSRYPASQPDLLRARHRQLQLRWFVRPSEMLDLTTTAYYNGFHRHWYKIQSVNGSGISNVLDRPDGYGDELGILRGNESGDDALRVRANNRDYWSRGLQSVMGINVGTGLLRNRMELGVRVHQDSEERFQHEDGYRMVGGRMVLTSSGVPGSQSNRVSLADAFAFYLHDEIGVGGWTLSPGVRFETVDLVRRDYAAGDPDRATPSQIRENGISAWIPGVGATRVLMPSAHIFAGIHRGFGPPGPGASAEARPEESVNYEAGVRVRTRGLAIQATAFYSDYGNILGKETLATGESGVGDTHNGGSVDVQGLEGSGDYDLA